MILKPNYPIQKVRRARLSFLFWALPLSLLSLQFYVFPSGQPQPSHFLVLLFILVAFFSGGAIRIVKGKPVVLFALYTVYTIIVNTTYLLITSDDSFFVNTVYSAFNFALFVALSSFYVSQERKHFTYINLPIVLSLFLTVFFYLIGIGHYNFFPRYNAFFNDPNQMAHWALCCFSVVCLLGTKTKWIIIGGLALLIICASSSSRSALLGLFPMMLGTLFLVRKNIQYGNINPHIRLFLYAFILLILIVGFYLLVEYKLWERLESISFLLDRAGTTDTEEQLEVRGYNLIYDYSEYLFLGAGQGGFFRFDRDTEIHSNWVGILFYYGFLGLFLFLSFLYTMFKEFRLHHILIAIGPLVYGFSTFGLRTPVFYFYLAALFYVYKKRKRGDWVL